MDSAASEALRAAQEAIASLQMDLDSGAMGAPPASAEPVQSHAGKPMNLPDFDRSAPSAPIPAGIDLIGDVNLNVKIELGRTRMLVEDVLKLSDGAVVELDKLAGDPVDVYVNERHIARGEVLVVNDNFCVRINEILRQAEPDAPAA